MGNRVTRRGLRRLQRKATRDVGREPNLDSVQLPGLLGAVTVTLENFLPGHTTRSGLRGGENALDVNGSLTTGFPRIVDDHLAKVVGRPQRTGRHQPDFDEVSKVSEAIEIGQSLD